MLLGSYTDVCPEADPHEYVTCCCLEMSLDSSRICRSQERLAASGIVLFVFNFKRKSTFIGSSLPTALT